mmetsp:Transcript_30620/g.49560  ORF Transcript_30620/g.49560 Transcript_30620/m.49560 type:complete len:257 (-) Transcript_30620:1409-2179(-)
MPFSSMPLTGPPRFCGICGERLLPKEIGGEPALSINSCTKLAGVAGSDKGAGGVATAAALSPSEMGSADMPAAIFRLWLRRVSAAADVFGEPSLARLLFFLLRSRSRLGLAGGGGGSSGKASKESSAAVVAGVPGVSAASASRCCCCSFRWRSRSLARSLSFFLSRSRGPLSFLPAFGGGSVIAASSVGTGASMAPTALEGVEADRPFCCWVSGGSALFTEGALVPSKVEATGAESDGVEGGTTTGTGRILWFEGG